MDGTASYVEPISCFEIKRDVAELPASRGPHTRPSNLPTT